MKKNHYELISGVCKIWKSKFFRKMRIVALLILISITQTFALDAYAQNKRLNIDVKNETILNILGKIEDQSEFYFMYDASRIDVDQRKSVNYENQRITNILDQLFENTGIIYSIKDRQILLTTAEKYDADQQKSISGIVTDESGLPLPGVTVFFKGTTNGTITNNEGRYTISNIPEDAILMFSFVGMKTREIAVGTNTTIDVIMAQDAIGIDEVVAIGYGTESRKNITTSVSSVDPDDLPKSANNSVAQLLFGRASGLKVRQTSAEPGGNINLSIRGRGNPLIVIDGVQMPSSGLEAGNSNVANELNNVRRGGFAGLSPDDIESIEVLKDASAAIYGVNAADGVILITTKKGKAGKMNISYNGSRSSVQNMKYFEPLSPHDYMTNYNQFTMDRFLGDNSMAPFGSNTPDLSGYQGTYSPFTEQQIANAGVGTNWLDLVLQNGSVDNHSLSISGGTEKMTYYMSGSFFNQEGTVKKSGMQRYTGKVNLSFKLNNFLTLNTSLDGSRVSYNNPQSGWSTGGAGAQSFAAVQAAVAYPTMLPVYDEDGNYSRFANIGNPVSLLEIKDDTYFTSLLANVSLDVEIIPNVLTGKLSYGNTYETSTRDFFVPVTTFYFEQNTARGSWNEAKRQWQTMEATLSFKKSVLDDKLTINAVAGIGQYPKKSYGFGAAGAGMLDAINTANLGAATTQKTISSYKAASKTRSYFARSSFNLLDRYILQLGYRYDGFNGFFPENKYASFPSASLGWKLSNESFLQNIDQIDLIKLRGSVGQTGTIPSSFVGSAYAAFVPDNNAITFNDGTASYIPYTLSNIDRPDLKWPKTIMKNIGVDFSLFKEKVSGSIDWFQDDITNLITYASTEPLNFLATQPINGGHQVRKGWEIELNTVNFRTSQFQWSSNINLSHLRYDWKERFPNYVESTFDGIAYTSATDPVSSIYVFKTNGILQVGETAPSYQPEKAQIPGSPIFVDVNDDNKIDANDIERYDASPDFSIGFGNTFQYKNIDLTVFFYGQVGGYGTNYLLNWASPLKMVLRSLPGIKEVDNVWSSANPNGKYPGVNYNEASLSLPVGTDVQIQKTDFIRCRNITLGYNFKNLKRYVNNLRVYLDVQNAFIITNFEIADPEVDSRGNSSHLAAPYPMARTFSLGVNVNF
ncbi:SusC/RagA family TonB-linked outer membrane protein [uncultured Draconibacterium sp.]|uniref:SusC/RagA family TonB-linked outer membrane protein n=1 Tax=uncultured Draconibacterium sp. TaxID=1573823 RepID=UPI00321662FD